jgi:hypothetical protein
MTAIFLPLNDERPGRHTRALGKDGDAAPTPPE